MALQTFGLTSNTTGNHNGGRLLENAACSHTNLDVDQRTDRLSRIGMRESFSNVMGRNNKINEYKEISKARPRLPSVDLRGPELDIALALVEDHNNNAIRKRIDQIVLPAYHVTECKSNYSNYRLPLVANTDESTNEVYQSEADAATINSDIDIAHDRNEPQCRKVDDDTDDTIMQHHQRLAFTDDEYLSSLEVSELIRLGTKAGISDNSISALKVRRRKLRNRFSARESAQKRRSVFATYLDSRDRLLSEYQQLKTSNATLSHEHAELGSQAALAIRCASKAVQKWTDTTKMLLSAQNNILRSFESTDEQL